jgi:hypothetical protein
MAPASNGTSSNGASAHLQRLEEAERRKREMEQKRAAAAATGAGRGVPPQAPPSRSASASASTDNRGAYSAPAARSSRERSQRRNGTYTLLLVTTLTATVGLNVAHHTITGGGATLVSARAAEDFLAKHFNTAMDVIETEVHQLENHLGHVWHGRTVRHGGGAATVDGDNSGAAGGMKPWLNNGGREVADSASAATTTDNDGRLKVGNDINTKDGSMSNRGEGHTSTLGGLSCAKHGGPSDEVAAEMVYWSDIPIDSNFVSPFKKEGETRYMTFEPDGGTCH